MKHSLMFVREKSSGSRMEIDLRLTVHQLGACATQQHMQILVKYFNVLTGGKVN